MDTVQSLLNWLNAVLAPVASALSAPAYIVLAALIGLIVWWAQAQSADRKHKKLQADIEKLLATVQAQQRVAQRGADEPAPRRDQQLRDVLTTMAEEDQSRARKVVELLTNGETAKAGALSRSIAEEAEAHLGKRKWQRTRRARKRRSVGAKRG
jgi:hypothetical protein